MKIKYLYQKKAIRLAKQIFDGLFGTWKECLKEAHKRLKKVPTNLITFTKVSGKIATRVVTAWSLYNEYKGTGKAKPEGLKLFADLAKVILGKPYNTISAYQDKISLFA